MSYWILSLVIVNVFLAGALFRQIIQKAEDHRDIFTDIITMSINVVAATVLWISRIAPHITI